ncbi:PHO85 cyclin-1 [Diaporthe helianthi]|uniref:PHO85 cyclin-1 n=1 Tax=Diaporthe helianthi TaxID=158607 RepID=A0A2P5HJ27_DIAHE|nr:PHO85 cyclin-1 [Diaporthe helianthi]
MPQSYSRMVLESNEVGLGYNVTAALACWAMLAGFFILPGTFTSIKRSTFLSASSDGRRIQSAVQNVPLLPVASFCYVVAIAGLGILWRRFRANYIWVIQHILL